MRLGGPTFGDVSAPEKWIVELQMRGYRAAYCPLDKRASDAQIAEYRETARQADIVIAEVGAWSNPISPDAEVRKKAFDHCCAQLHLAEKIGARCCVNIAGSRHPQQWDGPHQENLSEATFQSIVETTQAIIDAVKPIHTFYTLETMPWIAPDSVSSYARLLAQIDRTAFAVHLDPCNLIHSPARYYGNAELLTECFAVLGPHIKSCHAKDVLIGAKMTMHIDEVRPGLGELDYRTFLRELQALDPDLPLMLEHLPNAEEYTLAAAYVRSLAEELHIGS